MLVYVLGSSNVYVLCYLRGGLLHQDNNTVFLLKIRPF